MILKLKGDIICIIPFDLIERIYSQMKEYKGKGLVSLYKLDEYEYLQIVCKSNNNKGESGK